MDFCLIFVPFGHYDEPEILRYANTSICPKGADVRHVEANGLAQSTEVATVMAGSIVGRGAAFGMATQESDCDDWPRLLSEIRDSVAGVRAGTPRLHVIRTRRLRAHSKGDDTRSEAELAGLRQADPMTRMMQADDTRVAAMVDHANLRIETAVAAARAAEPARPRPRPALVGASELRPARLTEGRLIDRIHRGLARAMADDPRTILLGEDIEGPYGGAFKATRDLSAAYPGRVLNTAISEATIVGMATGLALGGFRPVAEIMFGDFLTLGFDQLLNHAAKFQTMYGNGLKVPMTVRTPMGGRRGYGPTHSQSLEKHFLGIPGLTVAALHPRLDADGFYAALPARINCPHLIIENKISYGADATDGLLAGFDYLETEDPYPTLVVRPRGVAPEVTVVCYGGMLSEVEKAMAMLFIEHEIATECICPVRLDPLDASTVVSSAAKTGRVLVAEEGQKAAGFGAELSARLSESGVSCRFARVAALPEPISAAVTMEKKQLPDARRIAHEAVSMMSVTS